VRAGRSPKNRVRDRVAVHRIAGVVFLLLLASSARAVDFSAAGSIFTSKTDDDGFESENQQERLGLILSQRFTPYISADLGYQYFRQTMQNDLGADTERRTRSPLLELFYNRERLSARLALREQTTDGTALHDNFVVQSLHASVTWWPTKGPSLSLSFRDESNVADVAVFGRNVDSRFLDFDATYSRGFGGASYAFQRTEVENKGAGLSSDQDRHGFRAYGTRAFYDNRLELDVHGSVSWLTRETDVGGIPEFAEPISPRTGLFVIDTAPAIGALDPSPGLIDGDTTTPVTPVIEIGGANTYRNVGLELQVTQQVNRLEITVDGLSDSNLVWVVYSSPDNLVWVPLGGVTSVFDGALLRYTLFLPGTTARFFKAVNVSVNVQPVVRVTEMRALRSVDSSAATDRVESTLYRADVSLGYRPGGRVTARLDLGLSNDETVSAGLVRNKFEEVHAGVLMNAELAKELRFNMGFRYADSEDGRQPVLYRTEYVYNAGLRWTPLETLEAALIANRRDEEDRGALIQSNRSLRLALNTVFLPDLSLLSDLTYSNTLDSIYGLDREGLSWRETLAANLTTRWILRVGYGRSSYENVGGPDLDRSDVTVYSRWSPTAFLTATASLSFFNDQQQDSVRQNYAISYMPGPKLNISAAHQENSTDDRTETATDNVGLTYRVNRRLSIFGNLSHSTSKLAGVETGDVTSVLAGLRFAI